ncbi:MAG TPA: NYN domain-containing protein [Armatimonadota bacterium]|jgi:uncharacterized LabA/DUF88 family protein
MSCVLFVDYENIAISLGQTRQLAVSPLQLARVLREKAEKFGRIKVARAFADWDRFSGAARAFAQERIEPRFVLAGKNSADMELSLQVQEALSEGDSAVDTYILATGDRDFLAIIERLKRDDRKVVVWGVEEHTSERLRQAADEFVSIEELLGFAHPPQPVEAPAPPLTSSFATTEPAGDAASAPIVAHHAHAQTQAEQGEPAPALPTGRTTEAAAWTIPALAALILRVDLILHQRGWSWMAFKTLSEELASDTTFGHSQAERAWWVNLAVSEGVLKTEKRPHARNPEAEITACSLNPEHPLVATALTLVPRILTELREQLYTKPWVAYGLLDRALAADPSLGQEAVERRFWINTLIHLGVILTEKRDNPNFPERPVTGCRLNAQHPMLRRFRSGPHNPDEWLDYHLILMVEHFVCTKEVPWMSMGQLRRALEERYGAEKMRLAVERAVNDKVLLVEHYPNRLNPERPTAGCQLNPEHPHVTRIRRNIECLIRLVASQLRYRPWAPIAALEKSMRFHRQFGETDEETQAWLALLMEQGVLLVDKRPDPADPEYATIACRLNFADKLAQSALEEETAVTEADEPRTSAA